MTRTFLILLASVLINSMLFSQNKDLKRVEIEIDYLGDVFTEVIPVGEKGLIILSRNDKETQKGIKIYRLTKYDTEFNKQWETELPIKKKLFFDDYTATKDHVFLTLKESDKKKLEAQFFQVDITTGNFKFVDAILPNVDVNQYVGLDGNLYVAGYVDITSQAKVYRAYYTYLLCCIPLAFGSMDFPTDALVTKVDFNQNKTEIFPTIFQDKSTATSLCVNRYTNELDVILIEDPKGKDEQPKPILRSFDTSGKYKDVKLKSGSNREVIDSRVTAINANEKILIGNYMSSDKQKRKKGKVVSHGTSEGLFFSKISDGKQQYIKFYPFKDFNTFYTFLKEKNIKKIKGELVVRYNVLLHDIVHQDNQYILIGEAYYPEYESETYMDANGKMSTRTVFVGYRFTHAIVAAFNNEGDLAWETSFEIQDILSKSLTHKVQVLQKDDYNVFAYNYNGAIHYKVVKGGKVETGKTTSLLETGHEEDNLKESYGSDLDTWYDNYFVASGYQKIKNKDDRKTRKEEDIKKKRVVFYMNKIEFN